MSTYVSQRPDTISSQGICGQLQKQDTRNIPWDSGVGEIRFNARSITSQAPGGHTFPSGANRLFQLVWDQRKPPPPAHFKFNRHCVWCVFALVLVFGVKYRGLLIVGSAQKYPPSSSSFGMYTIIGARPSFRRWFGGSSQKARYTSSLSSPCRRISKSL